MVASNENRARESFLELERRHGKERLQAKRMEARRDFDRPSRGSFRDPDRSESRFFDRARWTRAVENSKNLFARPGLSGPSNARLNRVIQVPFRTNPKYRGGRRNRNGAIRIPLSRHDGFHDRREWPFLFDSHRTVRRVYAVRRLVGRTPFLESPDSRGNSIFARNDAWRAEAAPIENLCFCHCALCSMLDPIIRLLRQS